MFRCSLPRDVVFNACTLDLRFLESVNAACRSQVNIV